MGTWRIIKNTEKNRGSWNLSDFASPLNGSGVNFEVHFNPNSGTTQSGQCDNCWSKFFDIEYTDDDDNTKTTTTYELPYCYVHSPEPEVQYTFNVDFDGLSEGFSHDNLGKTYTIRVTSGTRSDSSAPYDWQPVSHNFSKTLSNNASFGFVDKGQQGGDQTVHGYLVVLNGTPNNTAVSDIKLAITQNGSNNHSEQTFNFRAEEVPVYEDIRLVPYITLEQYARPQETSLNYKYTLHFKSADNKRVGTTLYFMTGNADNFKVLPNGSSSCQQSITCADYVVSKSEIPLSGNKWLISPYDGEYDGLSTYENKDLVKTASASLPDCCEYTYQANNINIHFGRNISDASVNGTTNEQPGDNNYLVDGNKRYWLDLSQQTNYTNPNTNYNFTFIEAFHTNNIVKLANQVTFNSREDNEVSVSVYEDGAVFVDEVSGNVATVNQKFENITQFVNTVYPSGYTDIQACSFFDYVDISQTKQCIPLAIEDGELVKRDESLPSSTRAMHIELDEEPSDTQAMHIEADNN